jgi:hypothetical protein
MGLGGARLGVQQGFGMGRLIDGQGLFHDMIASCYRKTDIVGLAGRWKVEESVSAEGRRHDVVAYASELLLSTGLLYTTTTSL